MLTSYGIDSATAIAFGLLLFSRELFTAIIGGLYQAALILGSADAGSERILGNHESDSLKEE